MVYEWLLADILEGESIKKMCFQSSNDLIWTSCCKSTESRTLMEQDNFIILLQ